MNEDGLAYAIHGLVRGKPGKEGRKEVYSRHGPRHERRVSSEYLWEKRHKRALLSADH